MTIGVDVVDIDRLRSTLARSPLLRERLFSGSELGYCDARPDPTRHLAGTLAAKEAVIKALRLGTLGSWARRIEILRAADGAPSARVTTATGAQNVDISISHDRGVAVAVASRASGT